LRNYDDLKNFGLKTYDDDIDVNNEALIPPSIHLSWNNYNSGVSCPDQDNLRQAQTISPRISSLNPEEARPQYPN
ncbi:11058_t:CDS:1, partial [Funneliformis geosporum]